MSKHKLSPTPKAQSVQLSPSQGRSYAERLQQRSQQLLHGSPQQLRAHSSYLGEGSRSFVETSSRLSPGRERKPAKPTSLAAEIEHNLELERKLEAQKRRYRTLELKYKDLLGKYS